jgi:hypothetical protein
VSDQKAALANLSKEEKLKLLELVKEKKRRASAKKDKYVPNEGQLKVHKSEALERYTFFGNGSGKTTLLAVETHWAATGFNPITNKYTKVPADIVVLLDDSDKIGMRFMPELRAWYDIPDKWTSQEGKPHVSIIKYPNGSTVKFLTHGIDPLKAEGIELSHLFCDEPPPKHLYNALTRGMRKKTNSPKKTLIVGTPLAEPWLRTEVFDPWKKGQLPYVECFTGSSDMNKHNIDWERQEKWLARLSPSEREARRNGSFLDLSGAALAHLWRPERHLIEPLASWPKNWPCVIAIDPAQSKPHVAVLVGSDLQGNLYYLEEVSLRAPARDLARLLLDTWMRQYPVADIVCDSLGSSGMSGGEGLQSFIDVINDEGLRARATTYKDKSDEAFIEGIQNVLYFNPEDPNSKPRLRIYKERYGIIADIENVSWVKVRFTESFKNKLDISKKDYLACLKYAIASIGDSSGFNYNLTSGRGRDKIRTLGNGSGFSWRNREIK